MNAMREMYDKMKLVKTPEDKSALMADHMKLMQDGMAMMGGMPGHQRRYGKYEGPGAHVRQDGDWRPNDVKANGKDAVHDADDDGPNSAGPCRALKETT